MIKPDLENKPNSNPWLTVKNLKFNRGKQVILNDINLSFHPGRHYILAGPNGAGKSTLLDIITGLLNSTQGEVELFNLPLKKWPKRKLAQKIALAPQDYRLNFPFTVRELVSLGRRPYLGRLGYLSADDQKIVDDSLQQVDMDHLAHKPVTELSGGEKQRVILARALAQTAPILILDEPTAGLDIAHALKVMALTSQKARAGNLIITVTHDLALAATYGSDFIFLKKGALVSAGPAGQVLNGQVLTEVYEVLALVAPNDFVGGSTVFFKEKPPDNNAKFKAIFTRK